MKPTALNTFITCLLMLQGARAQDSVYTNPLGIEFVLINPGNFVSGKFEPPYPRHATAGTPGELNTQEYALAERLAKADARPGFNVAVNPAFYMGRYEVTQAQWKKVMGSNPSVFNAGKLEDDADLHPVDNITWQTAQAFIKKLNTMHKGYSYRLPTEFEWEYAARAGEVDDIPWPEIRLVAQLNTRTTQQVGMKKPNAWGLYDMLGNVWEWVHDYYNAKLFADAVPPKSGRQHVLKGASFVGDVKNATYMTHAAGPANKWDVGFRLVMEVRR